MPVLGSANPAGISQFESCCRKESLCRTTWDTPRKDSKGFYMDQLPRPQFHNITVCKEPWFHDVRPYKVGFWVLEVAFWGLVLVFGCVGKELLTCGCLCAWLPRASNMLSRAQKDSSFYVLCRTFEILPKSPGDQDGFKTIWNPQKRRVKEILEYFRHVKSST